MDITDALASLSALAHDGRLAVFRLLVKTGPDGMAAGGIARKLQTAPNTMSAQLQVLSNAGLIHAKREGRSILYAADFARMRALLQFLTKDCCGGRPEICEPLPACAPAKKRIRAGTSARSIKSATAP